MVYNILAYSNTKPAKYTIQHMTIFTILCTNDAILVQIREEIQQTR